MSYCTSGKSTIEYKVKRIGYVANLKADMNVVTEQEEFSVQLATLRREFCEFNYTFKAFTIETAVRIKSIESCNQDLVSVMFHIANLLQKCYEA